MSTRTSTTCTECGVTLELDETTTWWTRQETWVDPDVLDIDNNGTRCADTNEEHVPAR